LTTMDEKLINIENYIKGWFDAIECDGVENRDCYMLCEVRNTCSLFNKILGMINS